jgi:hypothetical protein
MTQCDDCLNEKQIAQAEKTIAKYTWLLSLPPDDPIYQAIVRRERPLSAI